MKRQVMLALVMSLGLAACSEPEPSSTRPESGQDGPSVAPGEKGPDGERADEAETGAGEGAAAERLAPETPLPADLWRSAPSEVTLGDTVVTLDSRLWLRRLPVIGADGTAPSDMVHASVKLQTKEMHQIPKGLEIQRVLLMQGDQQWLAKENLDIRAEGELTLEVSLYEGPEWLPGSAVDIAVLLTYKGEEIRLIQHGVIIGPLRTGD
ncbi:hypothetical protein [Photobacterium sp. TY1-4]|uniref:hypothetical protein n=1 Tax=Photobacterium sp. TY1-4 TaxID=2899122 RepID=UPI0021BE0EFE|nr:hypothetical protein [Photobacterium sp. TY1-4]UXI00874.1 hypothetical protein NH461_13875 [Photobacterium sp. TY1-4]